MQKKATMYLRLPGERIMKLAEELYQAGFLSYPRTETDIFAPGFDLQVMAFTFGSRNEKHERLYQAGFIDNPTEE